MLRKTVTRAFLLMLLVALVACASPTPTPLPPTPTPVPPATLALPTATPLPPTATAVPSATPVPATAVPTPAGVAGIDYPLRIMPMGDYLTEGFRDKPENANHFTVHRPLLVGVDACGESSSTTNPDATGYRAFLRDLLTARGIKMEYVGSVQVTEGLAHEGHFAWTMGDLDFCVRKGDCMERAQPDLVLLYVGQQEAAQASPVDRMMTDLATLLDDIYAKAPDVAVIIAQIHTFQDWFPAWWSVEQTAINNYIVPFNEALPGFVKEMQTVGRKVYYVDLSGVAPLDSDYTEGMPSDELSMYINASAYERMAKIWYAKIMEIVEAQK